MFLWKAAKQAIVDIRHSFALSRLQSLRFCPRSVSDPIIIWGIVDFWCYSYYCDDFVSENFLSNSKRSAIHRAELEHLAMNGAFQ
jgi:hypothetical protein